jgi:hypothetical protein
MTRAKKMLEDRKVFYWNDTGPVEAHLSDGLIVRAQMIEAVHDDSTASGYTPWWEASDVRP